MDALSRGAALGTAVVQGRRAVAGSHPSRWPGLCSSHAACGGTPRRILALKEWEAARCQRGGARRLRRLCAQHHALGGPPLGRGQSRRLRGEAQVLQYRSDPYAMVGLGGAVAAMTRGPFTGMMMVYEPTGN